MTQNTFQRYIWVVLAYTLIVIMWGAFVRATGSGAGCGSHWPLCNGEVVPREPAMETIIEVSHRVTSGFLLILVGVLTFQSFRLFPKGHIVRKGGVAVLVFVIIEALIGALLVLFELVAHNASLTRAFSMAAHLVNTLLLLAAIILTGLWSRDVPAPQVRNQGRLNTWAIIGILMTMLLGASGGIAALGDTLFPTTTFRDGLLQDLDPTSNLLLRLRVAHPAIAVATGMVMVIVARLVESMRPIKEVRTASRWLLGLYAGQLAFGTLNMVLLAPIPMQLIHLLLSDLIWFAFVALLAYAYAQPQPEVQST